jgi:hypothetical protein
MLVTLRLPVVKQGLSSYKLKNCKDKMLAVVFNEKNNSLLWQYYGEPKEGLKTGDIDFSEGLQRKIITDEGSCVQ